MVIIIETLALLVTGFNVVCSEKVSEISLVRILPHPILSILFCFEVFKKPVKFGLFVIIVN